MGWRTWNKIAVVSCSVAAGGALVCAAAVLNLVVEKKSALGFGGWALGVIVAVSLVAWGYTWACDKCEEYLSSRLERRLNRRLAGRPAEAATENDEFAARPATDHRVVAFRFPQRESSRLPAAIAGPRRDPGRIRSEIRERRNRGATEGACPFPNVSAMLQSAEGVPIWT